MGSYRIDGLYRHQKTAVDFLLKHSGGCLFMEPGTGKTRCALEFILQSGKQCGSVLIVAPPICLSVWEEELAACFPLEYTTHRLDKESYPGADRTKWNFFLVSYGWLINHTGWLWFQENKFDVGICDESHFMKNPGSKRTQAVLSLSGNCASRLCLTGTPVATELLDVYPQFQWASPEVFPETHREFMNKWAIKGGYYKKSVVGIRGKEKLIAGIAQGAYSVRKEDCLDLPELTIQRIPVTLGKQAQQLHDEIYLGMKAAIRSATQIEAKSPTHVLHQIGHKVMQLQRITGGFFSHIEGDGGLEQIDNAKLKAAVDLVEALDQPVVIFVRFRAEIDALIGELKMKRVSFHVITGDTDSSYRIRRVDDFARGKVRVLLMQEQLAIGINRLTCAQYAIFFSWDYNYINWKQCVDRLHRLTQRFPVVCYMLTGQGTIDEKVLKVLQNRGTLSDLVLSL